MLRKDDTEYLLGVVEMDLPNNLWDFAEVGGSIGTSLMVDVVRDFSFPLGCAEEMH